MDTDAARKRAAEDDGGTEAATAITKRLKYSPDYIALSTSLSTMQEKLAGSLKIVKTRIPDNRAILSETAARFSDLVHQALQEQHEDAFFREQVSGKDSKKSWELCAYMRNYDKQFGDTLARLGHTYHIPQTKSFIGTDLVVSHDDHGNLRQAATISRPQDTNTDLSLDDALARVHKCAAFKITAAPFTTLNSALVHELFVLQSKPWEAIATVHVNTVSIYCTTFLQATLACAAGSKGIAHDALQQIVKEAMHRRTSAALEEVTRLSEESKWSTQIDQSYTNVLWAMRQARKDMMVLVDRFLSSKVFDFSVNNVQPLCAGNKATKSASTDDAQVTARTTAAKTIKPTPSAGAAQTTATETTKTTPSAGAAQTSSSPKTTSLFDKCGVGVGQGATPSLFGVSYGQGTAPSLFSGSHGQGTMPYFFNSANATSTTSQAKTPGLFGPTSCSGQDASQTNPSSLFNFNPSTVTDKNQVEATRCIERVAGFNELEHMLALYQVRRSEFVRSVACRVIERHLFRDLHKDIFTPAIVEQMNAQKIADLVSYQGDVMNERREMLQLFHALEETLAVARAHTSILADTT